MAFAVLAWAYCIFSLQGNSQDLYTGSGMQRHASFIVAQRGAEEHEKKEKMSTVFCPNKLCGKEVSDQFEKCPFCGTPLHEKKDGIVETVDSKSEKRTTVYAERSGWYTYATIMMVLSAIGLVVLAIASISMENIIFFIIGLGEFIMFSLFCGIVQLLAGIKQGIDNLQKNKL
jgi:hypothetical protein